MLNRKSLNAQLGENEGFDRFLQLAVRWLIQSDIRNKTQGSVTSGGFNEKYDIHRKSYSFVFSEITGYAINLFVDLFHRERNPEFLVVAKSAGEFLVNMQCKNSTLKAQGAFFKGYSYSQKSEIWDFYSFDAAICISALVDLYQETNNQIFLDAATFAGEWLTGQMQYKDGSFRALYSSKGIEHDKGTKWFGDRGCLHAKNAIGLLKLYDATKSNRFEECARNVCDWVLSLQELNGAFVATEGKSYVFTHAHCYATEGLLYASSKLNLKNYYEAAVRAGHWLILAQNQDGSLNQCYNKKGTFPIKRSDATAQAFRIWIYLYNLTTEQDFLNAALKSATFLMHMQCRGTNDSNALGGVFHQSRELWKLRYVSSIITAWPTMFAVHSFLELLKANKKKTQAVSVF
jgi:uncharacterized protein YyaL (SSP411 family)